MKLDVLLKWGLVATNVYLILEYSSRNPSKWFEKKV